MTGHHKVDNIHYHIIMFCCVIIFFVTSFLFLVCLHFVRIFLRVGLENDLSYWNIHCHPDRFAVTFQYN